MANHLIAEKSPYLRQHAHNPVDWYPWGEAALARAQTEDKPVFLSIGYATCHWCHVMERESFEDDDVAALLNRDFICVKVDREERPDLDQVYMTVCQALTGSGGWPLTVVLTPTQHPFFAATYIPKDSRFGRMGLLELLPKLATYWRDHRGQAEDLGRQVHAVLSAAPAAAVAGDLDEAVLHRAYEQLQNGFDARHGGFGNAPKFPLPHHLLFLLRYWQRTGASEALTMVTATLTAMRRGGLYDHLGGGFHRYATDERWLLPHFEKMLYDQALLTLAYLEAYQATGEADFATVARETLGYVLGELRSPEGGFFSADDADSEGVEGKYYVWTEAEVRALLSPAEADLACRLWNVLPTGNFAEEASGRRSGHNILHLKAAPTAAERSVLARCREQLLAARGRRVPPLRDDKVLTDWNGLAIAALARASWVLGEAAYHHAAQAAAEFVLKTLRDEAGRLRHRYREGEAAIAAFLDDYAFLAWGLLELYEADFDPRWLREAAALMTTLLAQFRTEEGVLSLTAADAETLFLRPCETHDGALPSGNSVALANLVRLGLLTGETKWAEEAEALRRAVSGAARRAPLGHTALLCGLDLALGPTREVVVCGERDGAATAAMLAAVRAGYAPRQVVLVKTPAHAQALAALAPYTRALPTPDASAVAYLCRGGACQRPVTRPEDLPQA